MLYQKFIQLVESHAEQLTQSWLKEVKKNPSTQNYQKLSDKELCNRVYDVYLRFGNWVMQNDPLDKKTAEHFMNLGKERAAENIQLSEVIYALILSRVVMWKFIGEEGIISTSIDSQQALEFYKIVNSFYDKAAYFVALGYESSKHESKGKSEENDFVEKAVKSITGWLIKGK